jgi:DNA-binding transcriptional LysR family regulator
VDIRELQYFVAVAEAGGLRRAARGLCIAPSALSRALSQLEEDLGVQLLRRSAAGVLPTRAGEEFLAHARAILGAAQAAKVAMREHADRATVLRAGALAGVLAVGELTVPILRGYRDAHPALRLEAKSVSFRDQIAPLLDGRVDVLLARNPIDHPDVDVIPIAHEPRVLLVGADSDWACEAAIEVQSVLYEPTVPLAAPASWAGYWQLDDVRGSSNTHADISPVTTVNELHTAVAEHRAVISGSGALGRLAPSPTTRFIELHGVEPSTISVARRRGDRRPEVEAFITSAGRTVEQRIELLPGAVAA